MDTTLNKLNKQDKEKLLDMYCEYIGNIDKIELDVE